MFQLNDKIYRNLEEQVQKNKEDIAYHMEITQVLANFGITVLGRVNTYEDIAEIDEGENWGYGYLVGPEDDPNGYVVYVWTRPNPDIGKETAYWLNIGKISIVGPQGVAGRSVSNVSINANYQLVFTFSDGSILTLAQPIKGDKGDPGTAGKTPSITATREANGVRVKTFNGDGTLTNSVYIADGTDGQSIVGPQGIPGKGLNIIGTFSSISQAPTAQGQEMGDAFILADGATTTLYILTGTPGQPNTYSWQETSFGGGTQVTVNGAVQSTWDADTKLSILDAPGNFDRVYSIDKTGGQTVYFASPDFKSNHLVKRDSSGLFNIGAPVSNTNPTTKAYVDEKTTTLQSNITSLASRVDNLENSGGSEPAWNSAYSPMGTPLTLTLPNDGTRYKMMLCSEHGMGDNLYTSNVFLFIDNMEFAYATNAILSVGAIGATLADIGFYWRLETDYQGTWTFTPIYNAEQSTIHDVKLYYRAI